MFITPPDVAKGFLLTETERYISASGLESIKNNSLNGTSVLVGCIGSDMGNVAIVEGRCATNQQINAITNFNDSINPFYVYYNLSGRKKYFRQLAGATTTPILPKSVFDEIDVLVPEKTVQDKIVATLKNIDDKISNNNAISAELETMAKTLYDYWFLQFEFPNEEGKPYKSSGGKMVWNEELKKEIPEGWSVVDILSVCDVVDCLHSQKPQQQYESDEFYLLTLENLSKDGTIDLHEKYYISSEDYKEWISRIEVKENDFVVTNAGRAGDICKIPYGVKCAIGRNITAIRPNSINPYYLWSFFKSGYLKEQVLGNLDCGSFFMSFNVKSIKKLKILIPDELVYKLIVDKITPIILEIENNVHENQELASLRDFLLPLLMNGQVGFKTTEN